MASKARLRPGPPDPAPIRRLGFELVAVGVAVTSLAVAARLPAPHAWAVPAAVVTCGVLLSQQLQRRTHRAMPVDRLLFDGSAVWLVAAAALTPAWFAALLAAAVGCWYQWAWPATRGRRRLDMTLQDMPAIAASGLAGQAFDGRSPLGAICVAVAYTAVNVVLVGGFWRFVWERTLATLWGGGTLWTLDGCVTALGLLAAVAGARAPWAMAAALPISLLCQHALLHPHLQAELEADQKTGLANARGVQAQGERMVATARRLREEIAALMVDIDDFKDVNDTYGHAVGDEVIAEVGRRITDALRTGDLAGRVGGEEYAVVLRGRGAGQAGTVAERVRALVCDRPVDTAAGRLALTVSVGYAAWEMSPGDEDGTALRALLRAADVGLYRSKSAGKNCVRRAEAKGTMPGGYARSGTEPAVPAARRPGPGIAAPAAAGEGSARSTAAS